MRGLRRNDKAKQENTVKNDWPEVKRTFNYKKDGAL